MGEKQFALVCCFFGKWPAWMPLFCESVEANPQCDVLLFSDCGPLPGREWKNVKVIPYTFEKLVKEVNNYLGFEADLKNVRQVCNLKPVYGSLFKEELKDYPFWGQIDIDLFFGDIGKFIKPDDLIKYDVISTNHTIASGHFCIYRNTEKTLTLYKDIAYLKDYLDGPGFSLGEYVMGGHIFTHSFLKGLKFRFKEVILDDNVYTLRNRKSLYIVVDRINNRVYDPLLRREFMYVHFQDAKKSKDFMASFTSESYPVYLVTKEGVKPIKSGWSVYLRGDFWKAFKADFKWLLKYHAKRFLGVEPYRLE